MTATLIALMAWTGLAVQFRASIGAFPTATAALWAMLLYFTIIANLAVAIVFTAAALGDTRIASPFGLGGVAIAILLVGVVYNLLLNGMVELSGGARLADLLNHRLTPLAVSLFWLVVAEKGRLRWRAPLQWALLPLVYFVYAVVRGAVGGVYPYPFMNVDRLGWAPVLLSAGAMALGFLAVGGAMVWLDQRLAPANPAR